MRLNTCANGHFYDADKFQSCPHCGGTDIMNNTVSISQVSQQNSISSDESTIGNNTENDLRSKIKDAMLDNEVTVGAFKSFAATSSSEPVVGWLVCTIGKNKGQDFKLKSGRNFIGRSDNMDVALKGENTVSREKHAIIIYEPKMNAFLAQAGESKELFYLNGKLVVSTASLQKGDRLQVGEVELMFIPCCDENFKWEMSESAKQ